MYVSTSSIQLSSSVHFLVICVNYEPCSSFGAAGKEHETLVYNDTAFLLAMAIADGALVGYESLEDIQKQETPPGENELILRYGRNFERLVGVRRTTNPLLRAADKCT